MIDPEKCNAILLLHQEGMSLREIGRRLGVCRNTVRRILQQEGLRPAKVRKDKIQLDSELLQALYVECDGWIQRVHEKLVEERGIQIKYATLTRRMRELGIGKPLQTRCDHVPDEPGVEMQHDTSSYQVKLDQRPIRVIASLLYLRYSKRRYLKFYRSFNRFRMKCFFHEALRFWGYAARVCIIDNTNLARLRGLGRDAVIVPEMEAFSRQYGFRFQCHARGHANRKAGEERSFWTVETNFLPGRTFASLEDLNVQALEWSTVRMEQRPAAKSRLIPAQVFEHEKASLVRLPDHLPAPYHPGQRRLDAYGYIAFGGNFFWVPGDNRGEVRVLEYSDRLRIYQGRELLHEYPLPPDGVKNQPFSPEGLPKPRWRPHRCHGRTDLEEKRLRAIAPSVDAYLDFALKPKGILRHGFVRKLFALSQKMSPSLFIRSVERARKYGVTSVEVIERIAVLYLHQGEEKLPSVEIDEAFRERDAYVEGSLTDEPDWSAFEAQEGEDDG